MPTPGEHKTFQFRISEYAQAIGWTVVSREGADQRREGFPTRQSRSVAGRNARDASSLFFGWPARPTREKSLAQL